MIKAAIDSMMATAIIPEPMPSSPRITSARTTVVAVAASQDRFSSRRKTT